MREIEIIKRKIQLWNCGVSKLSLAEYLGVSKEELIEILRKIGDT